MPSARVLSGTFIALIAAGAMLQTQEAQPPQPERFRTGTNIIRVDATVVDRQGNPVPSLTADDFEIREDGVVQPISSFKFIAANGESTDDRSLPIRSQSHAAAEAAREDVRTFLIFWDDYHIEQFVSAHRAREALQRAVLDAFGPTDLVALMDPLTVTSAIEFTRDRRALADRTHKLQGRRGVYYPPRSAAEDEHIRELGRIEMFRHQVTVSAIKAAAAHLGTFGEGRKALIILSEGFRFGASAGPSSIGDGTGSAVDLMRMANHSNVAIHIVDPRGLQTSRMRYDSLLESVTQETGGAFYRSNDLTLPFRRAVREASAVYLLGYTRDMPTDGVFHQIKVRVKRGGFDVRARSGYWAPRAEEIERAKTVAAASVLPPPVAKAFESLPPPGTPRLVDVWAGRKPSGGGRTQITLAWAPRRAAAGQTAPARVTVAAKGGTAVFDGEIEARGTTFDAPAETLSLAFTVLSASGEVLDRETRTVDALDSTAPIVFETPVVFRARNPAELRAIVESPATAPIEAGREFLRTDRLFVRFSVAGASTVSARLMDRRGANLVTLPVHAGAAGGGYHVDLPLGSIAAGEFVLALDAAGGAAQAQAMVPFRVVQRASGQ